MRQISRLVVLLAFPLATGTAPALAQQSAAPVGQVFPPPGGPVQGETPATHGYRAALSRLGIGMNIPFTGDADQDFVGNLVPQNQAEIDMAAVELKYGRSAAIKEIARRIIANREKQNQEMDAWLRHHPVQQR